MYDYLVAAFGLTVVLCLAPIMLVSLVVAAVFLRRTRPTKTTGRNRKPEPVNRNIVQATVAFTRFFVVSMVALATVTIVVWTLILAVFGAENTLDFAAQSVPSQAEQLEEAVAPAATSDAERAP